MNFVSLFNITSCSKLYKPGVYPTQTLGWTIDPNSRTVWLVGDTTGPLLTISTLGTSLHTTELTIDMWHFWHFRFSKTTKTFAAPGLCWRKHFHYLLERKCGDGNVLKVMDSWHLPYEENGQRCKMSESSVYCTVCTLSCRILSRPNYFLVLFIWFSFKCVLHDKICILRSYFRHFLKSYLRSKHWVIIRLSCAYVQSFSSGKYHWICHIYSKRMRTPEAHRMRSRKRKKHPEAES